MSSISVSDVSMVFETRRGRVQAIDRVSLEIPDAHFACIVGASGCGKSTLLNIMGGLVRPTSGTVRVDGRQIHGPGTDRRLKTGTRVCSMPVLLRQEGRQAIGYSNDHPGGYAEYMRLTESLLLEVPNDVCPANTNGRWTMGTASWAAATGVAPDFIFAADVNVELTATGP